MQFHLFAFAMTFIYFLLLRQYKKTIQMAIYEPNTRKKRSSNFIYLLFVPLILYITYYLFNECRTTSIFKTTSIVKNTPPPSRATSSVLSAPFPDSD